MVVLISLTLNTRSEEVKDKMKEQLPMLLGTNNAGTLFYISFHPCYEEAGPNNALKVYVSAAVATKVTLEIEGLSIKRTQITIPNDVIEFNLTPQEGQMYSKGGQMSGAPQPTQVWEKRAIKVYADDPIVVYGVTRYRYTSDGFLAMPVTGLGKEYQVATYADPTNNTNQWFPAYTSIIAMYDNTKVTFKLGGPESSRVTLPNNDTLRFGQQIKATLFEGDVWLIAGIGPYNDITGSTIKASKPISVLSGSFCAYIPTWIGYCDFIIEQELPQNVWGTKYHVTPIIDRKNNSLIKIFCKEPFTNLYRDGQAIGQILNPGGLAGTGFLEVRSDPDLPKRPVVISSEKAINIVQYNPGQDDDGVSSDPFQMGLTPIEQYQVEIVFNTPGIRGGFGFAKNYINLVYQSTVDGGIPNDIEIATVAGGIVNWEQLNAKDANPGEKFQNSDDGTGRIWMSKTIKFTQDGVYRIRSKTKENKFAAYAYGFADYDSYGFPTSVALADLEIPDTLAPVIEYTIGCDGNVDKGLVTDEPRDNSDNRSNMGLVMIDMQDTYNYEFKYDPFVIGEDMKTNWFLKVIDPSIEGRAHLIFQDRVGNRTDTVIQYFPVKALVRTKDKKYRQNYGSFKLENPAKELTYDFEIYNDGKSAIPSNYKLYLKQDSKLVESDRGNDLFGETNFDVIGLNGINIAPLAPGESKAFKIKFTARIDGFFYDSIGVVIMNETGDTCWSKYTTRVEGSVGIPKIAADDHDFLAVTVNSTVEKVLEVKNRKSDGSSTSLMITGVQYSDQSLIDNGVYVIPEFANISDANPLLVNMDGSFKFTVKFTPKATITYPLTITFIADANEPDPLTILNGIGIQPNLTANNEEWPILRVDYKSYYTDNAANNRNKPAPALIPPYISVNPQPYGLQVITLMNGGTKEVTLKDATIIEQINGGNFIVEFNGTKLPLNDPGVLDNLFKNKKVAGNNGELAYKVEFHPKNEGYSKLVIKYSSDAADQEVTTVLEGYGKYPKSNSIGYDFGELVVGNGSETRTVIFENKKWNDDYSDVLLIKDLIATGPISTTANIFTYDVTKIKKVLATGAEVDNQTLPITLLAGESIEVPVTYEPTAAQAYSATLTTVSDAAAEVTAEVKGTASVYIANTTPDQVTICKDDTHILQPKFTNNSSKPVEILSCILDVNSLPIGAVAGNFTIDPSIVGSDVNGNAGELIIPITFTPTVLYTNATVTFKLTTDAPNATANQVISITVSSTFDIVNITADFTVKEVDAGRPEATTLVAKVKDAKTFNLAEQPFYKFEVEYENKFIDIEKKGTDVSKLTSRIKPAAIFNGYTLQNVNKTILSPDKALITFELKGTTAVKNFAKDAELFTILFDSYLPYYQATSGTFKEPNAKASVRKIEIPGEFCLGFGTATTEVGLKPVCVDSIRQIVINSTNFGLMSINPNPVTSLGGEISFSVGLENSPTELNIYNINGELVATPLSNVLGVGHYSVRIPIEMLGSGAYIYELKSSHYTDRKQMVITK